jgi:hypothetical protein
VVSSVPPSALNPSVAMVGGPAVEAASSPEAVPAIVGDSVWADTPVSAALVADRSSETALDVVFAGDLFAGV